MDVPSSEREINATEEGGVQIDATPTSSGEILAAYSVGADGFVESWQSVTLQYCRIAMDGGCSQGFSLFQQNCGA